ncbi:MAG TPA: alpha/beta fold hydrolase [Ramlibacter sp.]|nr:alpha/beta fold hydrolase [Ramlibacter sp.]
MQWIRRQLRRLAAAACIATLGACASAPSAPPQLVAEDLMIRSSEPGIQLFVRNKRPAGMSTFSAEKTVLFIHGATFPAESSFDLEVGGTSWMDYIARHGYDVYLVDVRGYGRSTRPAANPVTALGTIEHAHADLGTAVDFIRQRRGIERVNLLGFSLGTVAVGRYSAASPERVNKVVLYAPVWRTAGAGSLPAEPTATYRYQDVRAARARWLAGVSADKQKDLIPAGWFDAWVAANAATDPWGAAQAPPVMRVPNGPLFDRARPSAQLPYEPANIRAPILLVKAEWDADAPSAMAQALFPRLLNARYKQYLEIGEGTHSVLLEKNRMLLFRAVQEFLDGTGP